MGGRELFFGLAFWMSTVLSSCAYRIGTAERSLPGGFREVSVPIFTNRSQELGAEVDFTNALVRAIERAQVATVVDDAVSPLRIEGTIVRVQVISNFLGQKAEIRALPERAVLTTEYRVQADAELRLIRKEDQKIIWKRAFRGEKVYPAPRIGTAVLNSANVLYNQSARKMNLSELALNMMSEAHDRMTENF